MLVLLECRDQIEKRLGRKLELLDRLPQRNEDRVPGDSPIAVLGFAPPPAEQLQGPFGIARFVTQVVGPPAKGVDIAEMLLQRPGNSHETTGKFS